LEATARESEIKEPAIRFAVTRINRRNHPIEMLIDLCTSKPVSYAGLSGSPSIRPYSLASSDLRQRFQKAGHYAYRAGPQGQFPVAELIHYGMAKIKDHRFNHVPDPAIIISLSTLFQVGIE